MSKKTINYMQHFSEQSQDYLKFRPDYPKEMYQYLASLVLEHELAWDCGTGNGQAAAQLANYFNLVIATDISQEQLNVAMKKKNIRYHCWSAEKTEIPSHTVNLVTIAQALHWFDFDSFYREVNRVAADDAIIAGWCYALGSINEVVDLYIKKLYFVILGDEYWPKERQYINDEYKTIPFPYQKITTPQFVIRKMVDFSQLIGYLNTWSAVKEYEKLNQQNPIDLIYQDLQTAWGRVETERMMTWPIHLLVGKIST